MSLDNKNALSTNAFTTDFFISCFGMGWEIWISPRPNVFTIPITGKFTVKIWNVNI